MKAQAFFSELERQPRNLWLAYSGCRYAAREYVGFDQLTLPEKEVHLRVTYNIPEVGDTAFKEGVFEYHLSINGTCRGVKY